MSSIGIKVKTEKMLKVIKRVVDNTKIIKRQFELVAGEWNFVIYGPGDNNSHVIREGCARHISYNKSSLYVASAVLPGQSVVRKLGIESIPMEVFTNGDVPEELKDLEICNIEPLRNITIVKKIEIDRSDSAKDIVLKRYEDKNTAIIETPDESCWGISLLKYLNECDEYFPDVINQSIMEGRLPLDVNFIDFDSNFNKNGIGRFTLN